MRIVLDSNVFISALIRDSTTRQIIVWADLDLYFPESALHSIRKYEELILKKSGITEADFYKLLEALLRHIKLVPDEEIKNNLVKAKQAMEHVDPEDVLYVATALGLEDSVVWSNDKDFEKQSLIKVLKTEDLVTLLQVR
ncbi:PIN domain-containing protein [Candidatus Micrarchaeota archaeon]|nr:PIN domain-containing protein [Candidatus Micrarchaeota archaeon]